MATFGKTDVGPNDVSTGSVSVRCCKYSLSEAGSVTSMSVYLVSFTVGKKLKLCIYSDNSGTPNALLGVSNEITSDSTSAKWFTATFSTPVVLAIGTYWLGWLSEDTAHSYYYAAGSTNQYRNKSTTYPTFPDPFGTPGYSDARAISIYATYTVGATLKTVTDSLGLSDSILRNKTVLPIADAVGVADAILRNKPSLVVADQLALADLIFRGKTLVLDDAVGLADTILRNKTLTISDSVGATDNVLGNKSPLIVVDVVSLADLVEVITGAIMKTVLDVIGATDLVLVNKPVAIADTVNVLDAVFRHKPSVLILDAVSATEAVLISKLLMVADSVNLTDVVKVLKTLNVSDTLTLTDAVSTPSRVLQALDSVGLADNAFVNKTLVITENVSLVEVIQVGTGGVAGTSLYLVIGNLVIDLKTGKVGFAI